MRLAIAQPGTQSVTAMGLIAPVYASGLPWPVRAGAAVGHRAVAFADALHWRARAQPAGSLQVRCWQWTVAERAAALAAAQHSEPLGPWLKPRLSLARCAPPSPQHHPQHREGGI